MAPLPNSDMGPFIPYVLVSLRPPLGAGALQSLFLYSDTPPPSNWRWLLLNRTFTRKNTLGIWSKLFSLFTRSMKMEQCSETSAHKFQTLGNHSKEKIQQIKFLFIFHFHYFLDKRLNGI